MNLKQRIKEYNEEVYPLVLDHDKKLRRLLASALTDEEKAKMLLIDMFGWCKVSYLWNLRKLYFLLFALMTIVVGAHAQSTHVISNIPDGWIVNGQTPVDGKVTVADGSEVTVIPSPGSIVMSIETTPTIYYWGYAKIDDDAITVINEYYPNGEFKNLASVTVNNTSFLSGVAGCPIPLAQGLTIQNVGECSDIILFVPARYVSVDGDKLAFLSDPNYNYQFGMYPKSFTLVHLSFPYRTTTTIKGQTYYALLIQTQYDGAEYVFIQEQ